MESGAEARNLMQEPGLWVAGYEKRRGFATAKGEDYEVALCCLLFLRALRHASDFFLASNHDLAGIFDDVVLFYRLKGDQGLGYRAILLQAKHKDKFTEKKLTLSNPFSLKDYLKSFSEIRHQWELPVKVGNREILCQEIKLLLYSNAGCKIDNAADDVTDTPQVEHLRDFVNTGGRLLRISGAERLGLPQGEETSHFVGHLLLCIKQMSVEKADQYLEDELCNVLRLTSPEVAKQLKTELKRVVKAWWSEIGAVRYLTAESQEWKKVLEMQVRRFNRDTLNIDTRLNLQFIEDRGAVHRSWICVRDEFQSKTVRSRLFRAQRNSLVVSFKSLDDHLEEVQALWNSNICPTLVVDMSAVSPKEGSLMLHRLQEEARSEAGRQLVVIASVKPPSGDWTEVPAEPTWSVLHPHTQDRLLETPVRLQGEAVVMRDIVCSYVTEVMTDEVINWLCDCETEIKVGTAMPAPLELYVPRCLERSSPNTITADSIITTKTLLFPRTNISLEVLKRFDILFPFAIDIKTIEYPTIVTGICNDYDIRQLCRRFKVKGICGNISMEGFQGNVKEFIPFIWNCEEKIVVIEGPPGVGKSSFVTKMCSTVKEQFPEAWVLRLDMGRHTDYIEDTDFREVRNIKQFLIRSLPEDANNLERQILEHSLSVTGNVFLFLDAFDEVSPDFTRKCSVLLKGIAQTFRYRQMVVTTRPVTIRDVEEALQTKAFILPVFCREEQNLFFKHFSEAKKKDVNEEEISSLHNIAGTVLEIPLLCRMAAEVLLHLREHRLHQYSNPWRKVLLYELFVEQSVKDRVAEKLELDISKPVAKKLLESHKNLHIHNLQGLAVRKLLPLDQLPPLSVSTVTPEEKLGLVVNLGERVDFEHQTFAEYFLGCWLACHWQHCRREFLCDLLVQDGFQFVAATFSWSLFDGLPLHEAVARGDVDAVRMALASTGNTDRGGRSALHVAAMTQGDHREVWELLMASRNDLNRKDNVLGTTAVKYAEFSKNWEFADLGLEKGANVRDIQLLTSKETTNNALNYAVEKDLATLFQFITRRHSIIFNNESPLHKAAANNSKAVMKVLTKMFSKVDTINKFRHTPLHEGSIRGHVEAVTLVDINIKTLYGDTALTYAASGGHLEVLKILIENGADLNMKNNLGSSALIEAASGGHLEVVKILLENGADLNMKNNLGSTALIKASFEGHTEVVKILLENGADLNMKNNIGSSAFIEAASGGNLEVVKTLLENGADLNIKNNLGSTALIKASFEGHTEVVKILLENGADLNMKNNLGSSAFIEAVSGGHTEVVKTLLENGANLNMKNNLGSTALIEAASGGHTEVVKALLENGADLNMKNNLGSTALIKASFEGHTEVVNILLENGADLNIKTNRGSMALIEAASGGHLEVVKILLENGADLNIKMNGDTALEKAVLGGHLEVVSMLLQNGADVDGNTSDENTPLMIAASAGDLEMVKMLLDNGADLNILTVFGDTALEQAASSGHLEVVNMLLKNGADVNITTDDGHTALMKAASEGHEEMVELLLANGADSNKQTLDCDTALTNAASGGNLKMVKLLLDSGADLNIETWDNETALTKAASAGYLEVVKILLEKGADLNITTWNDETALIKAASGGHLEVVKILLEKGADLNMKTGDDETALTKAASGGNLEVVKILLEKGADSNMKIGDDKLAMTKAASRSQQEMVKLLSEDLSGLNINTEDDETTLTKEASGCHQEMVKHLSEDLADLNINTEDDETTMTKAEFGGHQQMVNLLSEDGAELNINIHGGGKALTEAPS